MRAYAHAFQATYTGRAVADFHMTVAEEVYFAKHLFRTRLDTFPASHAIMRVDAYKSRLSAATNFRDNTHSYQFSEAKGIKLC